MQSVEPKVELAGSAHVLAGHSLTTKPHGYPVAASVLTKEGERMFEAHADGEGRTGETPNGTALTSCVSPKLFVAVLGDPRLDHYIWYCSAIYAHEIRV